MSIVNNKLTSYRRRSSRVYITLKGVAAVHEVRLVFCSRCQAGASNDSLVWPDYVSCEGCRVG